LSNAGARDRRSCVNLNERTGGPTVKYLLLVCWDAERMNAQPELDQPAPPDDDRLDEGFPWLNELRARGAWVIGDQLVAPRRARTVRKRAGKVNITDGPFVETKEAVGGFDIIEAASFDEAVEIAGNHPVAEFGTIEVRPLLGG
jgi:hypothetical protein